MRIIQPDSQYRHRVNLLRPIHRSEPLHLMFEVKQKLDKKHLIAQAKRNCCSNNPHSCPALLRFAVLSLFLIFALHSRAETTGYSFALIGDMPYGLGIGQKDVALNSLTAQINRDSSIAWVLHVGDIKTGISRCSDAMFLDRKARFEHFASPFIYTPGDNEWVDCQGTLAGGFDPLERLAKLREVFFQEVPKMWVKNVDWLKVQAESAPQFGEYLENRMWKKDAVIFATIHVVNPMINENPMPALLRLGKRTSQYLQAAKVRDEAALHWLNETFDTAQKENAKGIVIAIHANPGLGAYVANRKREPFKKFTTALYKKSQKFPGRVVLAHGDSHTFRVDQPRFGKKKAPANFIRVESFGDNNGNWIKVSVDTNSAGIFSFAPVVNK